MSFDYFQGDPALLLDENGADIKFIGGQPVMDQGLRNVVMLDLFTRKRWWGNSLFRAEEEKIGSDFEKTARQAITVTALQKIRAAGIAALKWMVKTGLASNTLFEVRNPSVNRIDVGVLIQPPTRDEEVLVMTRHGANWIAQRDYPASRRLE